MIFGSDHEQSWHAQKTLEVIRSPRIVFGLQKRLELLQIQYFHCVACNEMLIGEPRELHIHHITPLAWGGSNNNYNLVIICKHCHNHIHGMYGDMDRSFNKFVLRWQKFRYNKHDPPIQYYIPLRVIASRLYHHVQYKCIRPFADCKECTEHNIREYYSKAERSEGAGGADIK